jgi:hypothetical protein
VRWVGRAWFAALVGATLVCAVGLWCLGPVGIASALAAACPNEASRQGFSLELPECRVYEQVTPVDKGDAIDLVRSNGFVVEEGLGAVAEDGDAVLFQTGASLGPDAPPANGAYVFSRGAAGWGTDVEALPNGGEQNSEPQVFDPADLSEVGIWDRAGNLSDLDGGNESAFAWTWLVGPAGGPFMPLHTTVHGLAAESSEEKSGLVGGSEDLSDVILASENHSLAPGAGELDEGAYALYEWAGGGECGSATSACKLVNVGENGELMRCGALLGSASGEGGAHGAVSSDGSKVFFTAPDPGETGEPGPKGLPGCWNPETTPQENPPELYMREGGERTVEISKPEEGVQITTENPMRPAVFVGASSDGSKVFFVTGTELTKDATGHAAELYEYGTESGKLTMISGGETGTAEGNVDFVGAIPSSGDAVYFTAFGDLAKGAVQHTEAAPGAGLYKNPVNLYRYDTLTGSTTFITTLSQCDPDGCETGIGNPYEQEFKNHALFYALHLINEWYTTGNGQFLVFGTNTPVTGFDNHEAPGVECRILLNGSTAHSEPPSECQELFRYDAAAAEKHEQSIVCVSCASGAPVDDAMFARAGLRTAAGGLPRPISENGEDVFFDTASALGPQASAGHEHVYEWHEGTLSMISSSSDSGNAFFLGSSNDGSNVFFTTHAQLVPADTDQSADIYDARVDGGFAGVVPPQCTGTGCQGVPAAPPIFATPSSETFAGVGNFPASEPASKPASKPKAKPGKCKAGFVKKHGRCTKAAKKAKKSAKGRK